MIQRDFIDIHSHFPSKKGEWVIENIHTNFRRVPVSKFSAGLHPWYITKDKWEEAFNELSKISSDKNLAALGECGLDKVCETDYTLQKEVFAAQITLANQIGKPLILHCVRAHEDVIEMLAKEKSIVPVIFHGFNKGLHLAEKIIAKGYYLSFGQALQRPHMHGIFNSIPATSVFLETDDADINIESIYETAASIRNISAEELSLQLKQNVQSVFNISV